jgi:hypothetical protein
MTGDLTFREALEERDIFLVAGDEDGELGPIFMFNNITDVEEHLRELTPSLDNYIRLLHGSLAKADYLPADFHNRTPFVICVDPDNPINAFVIESGAASPSELAEEIEIFLKTGGTFATIPDIDDIHIFYGYEISTCLQPVEEDIDEEAIETCCMVAEAARTREKT